MADWSVLPRDILILIVGRFETSFEIVLFRSVCSSWRSVVPSPRDSRCLGIKTHIPMFVHHSYRGKPRFISPCCTLKKIPVYLVRFNTPFGDDYLLAEVGERRWKPMSMSSPLASHGGLTPKSTILLFNSLTTQIVSLSHYYYQINLEFKRYFCLRTGVKWGTTSKTVEYLELNNEDRRDFSLLADIEGDMMIYSSLDMRWTEISVSPEKCRDIISFKGKFYVVDKSGWGHVFVIEPSLEVSEIPSVTRSICKCSEENLVKSGEELLLVQRFIPGDCYEKDMYNWFPFDESHLEHMYTWFRVFRLDDEDGGRRKWVQVNDLNDRVIFLGKRINLCCSVQNIPGAKENCIVFIDSVYGIISESESILLFDLRTKRTTTAFSECRGYMGAFGANLESLLSCGVLTLPNPANSIYDLFSDSIWLTKEKD
ncbi:PREDICTED: putative F-box protein At2g16290 [Camelina sativa]|uniref:F-box protein At2g16290 n=1 Tax=Camelina sativa TaxID=90675 RepID=A0ABM0XS33_CAMSA|nr:PREDICTED: putative F-box protein At2g16290 [Camelina sativa]